MNIALWIQTVSTIVIAFFAYRMWGNAEANLKNAAAMKELEETSIKIAMWPEIKQFIAATNKFVYDIIGRKITESYQLHVDYITELQLARFYFQNDDVLFKPLMKLVKIGKNITSLWHGLNESTDSPKRIETERELRKYELLMESESEKFYKILRDRYNFSTSTNES